MVIILGSGAVQASAQACWAAEHLLSRPTAYLRYTAAFAGHSPEAGSGASGARNHSHDSRHLLALPAEHGRLDREGYGASSLLRSALLHGCCTKAPSMSRDLSRYATYYLQKPAFSKWAVLGSNQRPPPCKGGLLCLPLFLVVHEVPANRPSFYITRSWLFAAVRGGLVY
jgi:hypothetical protein